MAQLNSQDRTPENEQKIVEAVCEVIRATGFQAMAEQFKNEPDKRSRIALVIGHQIARKLGNEKGTRFVDLAMTVCPDRAELLGA